MKGSNTRSNMEHGEPAKHILEERAGKAAQKIYKSERQYGVLSPGINLPGSVSFR